MLVGCGAGGAIAAAFGAPLTGAFYAFELIIGAYSLANAIPVFAATLAASLTTQGGHRRSLRHHAPRRRPPDVRRLRRADRAGLGCGGGRRRRDAGGGVDRTCVPLRRSRGVSFVPSPGGLLVGSMALYTPQVLGAGHGALGLDFYWPMTARELATLIVLKLFACLVSLASGFRGGMFFASLFVGSLLGKLYAIGVDAVFAVGRTRNDRLRARRNGRAKRGDRRRPADHDLLVLESTGNLGVAGGALAASIATTLAVRATFGYSFTTWRLHLRGETIRGGQDVGWLRELTVGG